MSSETSRRSLESLFLFLFWRRSPFSPYVTPHFPYISPTFSSKALDTLAKDAVCEMTGKDDYQVGDLSIEVDKRVKQNVATFTGKESYEAGDLSREVLTSTPPYNPPLQPPLPPSSPLPLPSSLYPLPFTLFPLPSSIYPLPFTLFPSPPPPCSPHPPPRPPPRKVAKRVGDRVSEFTGKGEYQFGDISREIEKRRAEWVDEYLGKVSSHPPHFPHMPHPIFPTYHRHYFCGPWKGVRVWRHYQEGGLRLHWEGRVPIWRHLQEAHGQSLWKTQAGRAVTTQRWGGGGGKCVGASVRGLTHEMIGT